jgi:hypothetical protein
MANRNIHYEACFEDYLRTMGIPYVAVDEAKKALFAGVALKSFDFVVYSNRGPNLLVDVKGRKFPYISGKRRRYWENWATLDDLESLARWEEIFGQGFAGLLVFCYHLQEREAADLFSVVHPFRSSFYGMVGVWRGDYGSECRTRSKVWGTASVPTKKFRKLLQPIASFF